MRKFSFFTLVLLCVLCGFVVNGFINPSGLKSISAYAQNQNYAHVQNYAEISMEKSTGTVVHSKNADIHLPMASTTKIMTAIIIIENMDLNKEIVVPKAAVGVEGSSIYLKTDEKISIRDLLYGLMLRSGNDAAAALAISHSGSVSDFVNEMNNKAKELGLKNTHFTNPSGLPDAEHYTTARELCEIARYALLNDEFAKIVSTQNYVGTHRSFQAKNKILKMLDGADGVKTGYTKAAGRCLVSSATRNGMTVISVVLNCPQMYERSIELIENVFNGYELVKFDEKMTIMCGRVLCKFEKCGPFLLPKDAKTKITMKKNINSQKVSIGDFVGELEIYDKNSLLLSQKLFSIVDIK